jgi:sensor histidine kinase YesM
MLDAGKKPVSSIQNPVSDFVFDCSLSILDLVFHMDKSRPHARDLKSSLFLVAMLAAGGFLMPLFTCNACMSNGKLYFVIASFCSVTWMAMWFGNEFIVDWLDSRILWTKEPLKRFASGLAAAIVYPVISVSIIMKLFELTGYYMGNLTWTINFSVIATSVITLFLTARSFLLNWRQAAIDSEKLQKEGMAAKYESLKNQVNPHFLFNSLNALTNLVYEDQDKAAKFIKQLSQVYRYVLDTRDKEVVTLEEESSFLNSYLFLQQIRFGDKLRLSIAIDDVKTKLPPLVLQMLIENAIKHNVISEDNPLSIRVYADGEYLVVENNLQRKQVMAEESPGIGLENICKRYEFLTNKEVQIQQTDKFVVRLPLIS